MDTLEIGIIGAGFIAARKHVPAIRENDRANVRAVCRRRKDRLAMAKKAFGAEEAYADWREMLEKSDLDAVIVCTPHDLHAEPSIVALQRGLHVLVEKPMAVSGKDARAVLEAANVSQRVLMVAYNHQFRGKWRTARRVVDRGTIGHLRQINIAFSIYRRFFWEEKSIPEPLRSWVQKATGMPEEFFDWDLSADWRSSRSQTGGGTLNNAGAHWTSLALWLVGSPAVEVSALTGPDNQDVEYFVGALARLANGVQLALTFADAVPGRDQVRLSLVGDAGMMTYDHTDGDIRVNLGAKVEMVKPEYDDTSPVASFVNCILDGAPNLSPGEEAANAVYFTEAVYRSAREHRFCKV